MTPIHATREQWLVRATDILRSGLFRDHGATVPNVRLSVGFPGGTRGKKAIGQIWFAQAIADGIPQVFVSPIIGDPVRALDILVHELVHACHPTAGHKGAFKRLATAVGLVGKMTATIAGPELKAKLEALSAELGPFPHGEISMANRPTKTQTTRLVKVACPSCEYPVRVTRKWLDDMGAPSCPCGETMLEA